MTGDAPSLKFILLAALAGSQLAFAANQAPHPRRAQQRPSPQATTQARSPGVIQTAAASPSTAAPRTADGGVFDRSNPAYPYARCYEGIRSLHFSEIKNELGGRNYIVDQDHGAFMVAMQNPKDPAKSTLYIFSGNQVYSADLELNALRSRRVPFSVQIDVSTGRKLTYFFHAERLVTATERIPSIVLHSPPMQDLPYTPLRANGPLGWQTVEPWLNWDLNHRINGVSGHLNESRSGAPANYVNGLEDCRGIRNAGIQDAVTKQLAQISRSSKRGIASPMRGTQDSSGGGSAGHVR